MLQEYGDKPNTICRSYIFLFLFLVIYICRSYFRLYIHFRYNKFVYKVYNLMAIIQSTIFWVHICIIKCICNTGLTREFRWPVIGILAPVPSPSYTRDLPFFEIPSFDCARSTIIILKFLAKYLHGHGVSEMNLQESRIIEPMNCKIC